MSSVYEFFNVPEVRRILLGNHVAIFTNGDKNDRKRHIDVLILLLRKRGKLVVELNVDEDEISSNIGRCMAANTSFDDYHFIVHNADLTNKTLMQLMRFCSDNSIALTCDVDYSHTVKGRQSQALQNPSDDGVRECHQFRIPNGAFAFDFANCKWNKFTFIEDRNSPSEPSWRENN